MDLVRRMGSLLGTGATPRLLEVLVVATAIFFVYFRLEPLEAAVKIASGSPMSVPLAPMEPASFD